MGEWIRANTRFAISSVRHTQTGDKCRYDAWEVLEQSAYGSLIALFYVNWIKQYVHLRHYTCKQGCTPYFIIMSINEMLLIKLIKVRVNLNANTQTSSEILFDDILSTDGRLVVYINIQSSTKNRSKDVRVLVRRAVFVSVLEDVR